MAVEKKDVNNSWDDYVELVTKSKTGFTEENLADDSVTPKKADFLYFYELGKNIYDYNAEDYLIGYRMNSQGTIAPNVLYNVSGFMEVTQGQIVTISIKDGVGRVSASADRVAIYDYNKVDLTVYTIPPLESLNKFTIPETGLLRLTTLASYEEIQVEFIDSIANTNTDYEIYNEFFKIDENDINMEDYKVTENFVAYLNQYKNKILTVNGDSIMAGQFPAEPGYETLKYMFIDQVADRYNATVSNSAIGGSTIAVKQSLPLDRDPIVTRYQNMLAGDVCIIAGGTNDWANDWTPFGDMSERTDFTFYGALHNLCLGLLEKYTGKPILFMTPIKRIYSTMTLPDSQNGLGKTLEDYVNAIKEVCGYYGIPVIDMYNECILNPYIVTQRDAYIPDATHPNTEGHTIMAKRLGGYLQQLI